MSTTDTEYAVEVETNPYEVVFSNGDRAEAESLEGIVLAAKTLCQDIIDGGVWGKKPSATFLFDGKCVRAEVPSYQLIHGGAI